MVTSDTARIVSLYRYPVKGLSPEMLESAKLETDGHFPGDRMFAIENGPSGFNPQEAEHMQKIRFLMLMKHERLARLKTRYDDATATLSIQQGGHLLVAGDLRTQSGREALEAFFASQFPSELRGAPKILSAPPGFRFMDSRSGFVSIIDMASVAAIAGAAGRENLDPLRFRANLYVEGWGAWGEFDRIGQHLRVGGATLEITKRIDRCAATDVDPSTGLRDFRMVEMLQRSFGHHDCGVYARIIAGGLVKTGDQVIEGSELKSTPHAQALPSPAPDGDHRQQERDQGIPARQ